MPEVRTGVRRKTSSRGLAAALQGCRDTAEQPGFRSLQPFGKLCSNLSLKEVNPLPGGSQTGFYTSYKLAPDGFYKNLLSI